MAYFDGSNVATVDRLPFHPVWPKDSEAPLCSCFGLTRDDVEQDIREGVVTRVRAVIDKAKSPEARCQAAQRLDGRSCVGEVQRLPANAARRASNLELATRPDLFDPVRHQKPSR